MINPKDIEVERGNTASIMVADEIDPEVLAELGDGREEGEEEGETDDGNA